MWKLIRLGGFFETDKDCWLEIAAVQLPGKVTRTDTTCDAVWEIHVCNPEPWELGRNFSQRGCLLVFLLTVLPFFFFFFYVAHLPVWDQTGCLWLDLTTGSFPPFSQRSGLTWLIKRPPSPPHGQPRLSFVFSLSCSSSSACYFWKLILPRLRGLCGVFDNPHTGVGFELSGARNWNCSRPCKMPKGPLTRFPRNMRIATTVKSIFESRPREHSDTCQTLWQDEISTLKRTQVQHW